MNEKLIIFCLVISVICIFISVLLYYRISKMTSENNDNSEIIAKLIIMDRKIGLLSSELENINFLMQNITPYEVKEVDEMTGYINSGMTVSEIAKKKNMSVKEVELILAMRGLI